MRWLPFAILALGCVTLQTTVAPELRVGGISPDWILVAVVFFAMHGRGVDSIQAAWVLGLLADFQSAERFGLLSLTYALAAGSVCLARDMLFRYHPLAHFFVTFMAGLIVHGLLWGYYLLVVGMGGGSVSGAFWGVVLTAAYSALWAPPFHALLLRFAPSFGFSAGRYTHAGLARAV